MLTDDKKFKDDIDQFRSNPGLSYSNFIDFIAGPLAKLQYQFIKMEDILSLPSDFRDDNATNGRKYSFVRHDIDLDPKRAVDLAVFENANGLVGTYHFISNPAQCPYDINDYVDDVIQIIGLGHEVGLHFNHRAHSELVKLQSVRSRKNGREEEDSELGHKFKRPSEGITVEDCLRYIGSDASHLANIINERLQDISSAELDKLTRGHLRKNPNGSIEIKNDNVWSALSSASISSFSYHMPPKGVIAHDQMIFEIPVPNAQSTNRMVYGYYKGFMENPERLSNRYRTDISAGGTAINHFGTPYHAYAETIEKGILPPPIIMINNHPEYWREEAIPQADVLKEYVEKLALLNSISFGEADEIMLRIKGESYFEHSEPSAEEKAINDAIQEGLLTKNPDGQLNTADGTHYIPPNMRVGNLSREKYFLYLTSKTERNSYAIFSSYIENPPLKDEELSYTTQNSFGSPDLRQQRNLGSSHRWLMVVSPDGSKELAQYNLNTKTDDGAEAARKLRALDYFSEFSQNKLGFLSNHPYYRTFDYGVVIPITQKQHSVLTVDLFIKKQTLTEFNFASIGNGRECESAAYTILDDIGVNLDNFVPIESDKRVSQVFGRASFDTISKYNRILSQFVRANAIQNVLEQAGKVGIKVPITSNCQNQNFNNDVPSKEQYFALFPANSTDGTDFIIMAAPHIESKAAMHQTLPFNGDLNTYSRPFIDIPAAWDILQSRKLISLGEGGVSINSPLNADTTSLDFLIKKKRDNFQAQPNSSQFSKLGM